MKSRHLRFAAAVAVCFLVFFAAQALAIIPPASPEWFSKRLKIPPPDTYTGQIPAQAAKLAQDLSAAAERQPTDYDQILLILVEFVDHPADTIAHPPSAFEDLMFSSGIVPTGSFWEYFQEISYGAFSPSGIVTAWITAPHNYSYYADNEFGMGAYPKNTQGLLEDCIAILDPSIDFSQFDTNGDGYFEGVFLVHAGPGAEETQVEYNIWSHSWIFEVATDDGVSTRRYSVEPEENILGEICKIGVYCHEYVHVMGFPDLYDYDGSTEGVGSHCLMGSGSWGADQISPERPTHMCSEFKRRLGWLTPIEVTGNLTDLVIPPIETHPVCYQVTNPANPNEFFLISTRAKIGFDSLRQGDGGLGVWHIDLDGAQSDEWHRYVDIEEADGSFDLKRKTGTGHDHPRTNRGDAGDLFPGAAANNRFSFATRPDNGSYDASNLVTITDIEYYGDSMRVNLYVSFDEPLYRVMAATVFDTLATFDGSNFNGDADSGEVVDLVLRLACEGEGAAALTGTISTTDPRVSLVTAVASFGSSTANDYVENEAAPFRFEVLSASTDSAVTFNLHLVADGDPLDIEFRVNINRQKILLVVDNHGSNWSGELIDALHGCGRSFDVYNVHFSGTLSLDDLIPYHVVIWTTASYFGKRAFPPDYEYCLTTAEKAVLANYLNLAGRLGLFSQDYFENLLDDFATDYLYVMLSYRDLEVTHLIGTPGGLMDGFDGYAKPATYFDYSDHIVPRAGAARLLDDPSISGRSAAIHYPIGDPQVGTFATTFCTFGIERFDDASLAAFFPAWYDWVLTNTNIDVPLAGFPRDGREVVAFLPEFIWSRSPGADSYHFQLAGDDQFTDPVLDTSFTETGFTYADTLPEGTYFWRVNALSDAIGLVTPWSPAAYFVLDHPITFVCGDANGDDIVNVADAVFVINYVFKKGPAPDPVESGDANADGNCDVADAVYVINFVFKKGPDPVCPD